MKEWYAFYIHTTINHCLDQDFKTEELGPLFSNSTTASFAMELYKVSGSWLYKGGLNICTVQLGNPGVGVFLQVHPKNIQ